MTLIITTYRSCVVKFSSAFANVTFGLAILNIYVASTNIQSYCDIELGDSQSLKSNRCETRDRTSDHLLGRLNHSTASTRPSCCKGAIENGSGNQK